MRVCVTGWTGFVGAHLVEYLLMQNCEVIGIARRAPAVAHAVQWWTCDLRERGQLQYILSQVQPDWVVHLAAVRIVQNTGVEHLYTTNVLGTLNLLEAIRAACLDTRILVVGSSAEYGDIGHTRPVTETTPLSPVNHYGISKATARMLSMYYARQYRMHIVYACPFNHVGPGEPLTLVCSRLAHQIARIKLGLQRPCIQVFNLDNVRDFTDVRDIVRAYWMLMKAGRSGEVYNICSERPTSIRTILNTLLTLADINQVDIQTTVSNSGIPYQVGSARKLREQTGWCPQIPLNRSLHDLFQWWVHQLTARRLRNCQSY